MNETKEDLENIKQKLIEHIKKNYPEEKSESFIKNINEMNDEEFVIFLKEQDIIKDEEKNSCIFCSIVFGDISSTKIGENKKALAVLDLNPASRGHTLIIPKAHVSSSEKIDEEIKEFVYEISQKLKDTFNPKKIEIINANVMGHEVINLLPVYDNESLSSQRKRKTQEELEELKNQILKNSKKQENIQNPTPIQNKNEVKKEITKKNTWLPKKRLP